MRKFLFILIALYGCHFMNAQTPLPDKKIKFVPGDYSYFSIDNLNNIYLLNSSNQLKKLNQYGDSISVFNDVKKFGEATLVDISNPVKILLYYKGFATIVVLDGTLNLKNTIDLRKKNIFNVTAVSLSYDGKIWVYDEMSNMLKKLDDEGNTIAQTADFRQVFDVEISPVKIYDQNQFVYLYDTSKGIYVFDYYGAYKNKIDIHHWKHLRIIDKFIYGSDNAKLYRYNLITFKYDEWPIPAALQSYRQLFLKENKLYALGNDGLEIYNVANN